MAKATRLRVTAERPLTEAAEPGSPLAQALNFGEPVERTGVEGFEGNGHLSPDQGAAIIAHLRSTLETERAQSRAALEATAARAQTAEQTAAEADAFTKRAYEEAQLAVSNARSEAERARSEAETAQKQARQNAGVLATIALGSIHKIAERLSWLTVFLLNKLPFLAALYGGFLLWSENLSEPTALKLIGLALYGICVIGPTAFLNWRADQQREI